MNAHDFWHVISLLDWDKTGDDDAVLKPAIEALSRLPLEDISEFEELLSLKLYSLDTKAHAQNIGEESWSDGKYFSADWFLYARCCVVANGLELYESVLQDPTEFPQDMEFEALLGLARMAYELKTKQECEGFDTSVSYETFSNKAGWA